MSEYHAAVGLAELDGWAEKRSTLQAVGGCYRRQLAGAGLLDRLIATPDISSSTTGGFGAGSVVCMRMSLHQFGAGL